ncbi:PH domain-containing protein [Bacillus cereus]|uniref:PH domain-containing protein n=1 Tax=Bacillus cereus TaxID=1396 RepID=UPI001D0D4DE5|nr:PH domain-containing protein [Bacillus cereus]
MYETLSIVIIFPVIFLIFAGFILWYATSITYIFYKDYLLIKGGPFKSKISYEDITEVSSTEEKFTGYRITSSEKGIELFYKSAIGGSINVLPIDKIEFITELRNRCPNVQIPKSD